MNVRCNAKQTQQKKPIFSPRPSPVKLGKPTTHPSTKCCLWFERCMRMGSTFSQDNLQTTSNVEQQLADLEREIKRQKELRATCRARLEMTQNYLRYCLQIAQDNGFLDHITKNNRDPQLLANFEDLNIDLRTAVPRNSDLAAIIDQAKINGWYIEPQEIKLQEQVGQGSTADIYRGSWRGLDVAVKCIYPDYFHSNESGVSFFAQEIETLLRQRHPFVLRLMGACLDPPENGWIVTEFLSMTLKEWLHGHGERRKERSVSVPPLGERVAKALEIAQAMQYLHEQRPKVIHRDLKPSNIFLDESMHIRVADFGHACFLQEGENALSGETGTYIYMAPEVIRGEPYNEKCDVYSFGVILNELITGNHPYIETDYGPAKIALEVGSGKLRPTLPKDDGQLEDLIDLICRSWDEDASMRLSFAMITCTLKKIRERFIQAVQL